MARASETRFCAIGGAQFRAQFRKVDFLGVSGFFLVFAEDHCAGEVLDGFFDYVAEDFHHGDGLFFGEAFGAQALDEFQGVELVVFGLAGGGGEGALGWGVAAEVPLVAGVCCGCGRASVVMGWDVLLADERCVECCWADGACCP